MYKNILLDFLKGVFASLRFDCFLPQIWSDQKLWNLLFKICKYNFLLHFLPSIIVEMISLILGYSLEFILYYIAYPINFFSIFFHLLYYTDLVNVISIRAAKTSNTIGALDMVSLTLTMSIYNIVIYLSSTVVNYLLFTKYYFFSIILNFLMLSIYHSIYCFNNLWQYKKINMNYRIDMHEKLWPYYIGYGTLSTIMYFYLDNQFIYGLYNIYTAVIISIPFLIDPVYPNKHIQYPNINLIFFSYITKFIFNITKIALKTIYG